MAPRPPDSPTHPQPTLPSDRDSSGRDLGDAELALLQEAIRSGHLNCTGGALTPRFEAAFAARLGVAHAVACNSGSAAVHAALGALDLQPGDEVVTTPITDMGAVLPIALEGALPVFADVDPATGNVTPDSIASRLTDRTRAVIVTHLFGQPAAGTAALRASCDARGIALIEDAAQSILGTFEDGALAGSVGHLACFSFQQGKHLTTGEGGMVLTADADLADRVTRFVNKGWGYGDAAPDHDRPGMNYRLTELQAAVGIAQLDKLEHCVSRRRAAAERALAGLRDLPGIALPEPLPGTGHAYWRFALRVDPEQLTGGPDAFGAHLRQLGVGNAPRYVKKPAFDCAVFHDPARFGALAGAFAHSGPGRPRLGDRHSHPNCYALLDRLLVLPWNEHLTDAHVDHVVAQVRAAHAAVRGAER